MEGKTHRTFGVLTMEIALISAGVPPGWPAVAALVTAAIAAYGPDIDSPQSTLSRAVPGGLIVGHVLHHRTVMHSLLVTVLLWMLITLFAAPWYVLAGVLIGWSSHWFIDLFNREGVQLFWPLPLWIKLIPGDLGVATGSGVELLLRKVLMLFEIALGWSYFSLLLWPRMTALPFAISLEQWIRHFLTWFHWPLFGMALHALLHVPR